MEFESKEQEVDGETLSLMNNVDSIKSIFPKYKQQLLFLRERKKLFDDSATYDENKENESAKQQTVLTSNSTLFSDDIPIISSTPNNTQMSNHIQELSISETSTQEIDILSNPNVTNDSVQKSSLPEDYRLSSLPASLLKDIDNGDLSKFNNHCKNRQILLDTLFFDLTNNYNIWYVSISSRVRHNSRRDFESFKNPKV
ncbi:unnamed protein product [Didymodactylos carnosus]|uniref:Uncharacterized protein n=1 Tax=Didymodactylos carnosus TaxID=1234261 RepID=A0A813ZM23_9BILA|nr:unnamed protein product [Didymodactylos carnosus]CAF3683136.1 unnamed protein product [Didymodactylos carnosus]